MIFDNKYRDYSERVNELRIQRSHIATDPFSFLSHSHFILFLFANIAQNFILL